jgi:molecular chaperone GrpE (heat shock protein)
MSDKLASFRRRTSQRAAEMTGQAAECKDEQFDVMEEQGHIHKQIVHDIRKEMDAHIQAVSEFIRTGLNVSQNIHTAFQTNTNSDPYLSSLKALSIWTALQDDFEKRAKNLYMTSVLGSMDTYIRELDQVKDLSSMRNKLRKSMSITAARWKTSSSSRPRTPTSSLETKSSWRRHSRLSTVSLCGLTPRRSTSTERKPHL